jgi:hypothetical protein
MSSRLPVTRASLLLRPTGTAQFIATRRLAPVRFASPAPKPTVKIDQTKRSNNPDESPTSEHHGHGITARNLEGEKGAAQPSPERSTGIQPSGPESRAGEGRADAVHREQLDRRTMGHSVNRVVARHEGTAAAARGGNAMWSRTGPRCDEWCRSTKGFPDAYFQFWYDK